MDRTIGASLALIFLCNCAALRALRLPFPPPTAMSFSREDAVQSAALLSLGMRRLAADLSFIQFLMYYGSEEMGTRHFDLPPEEEGLLHAQTFGAGLYPELEARALRIMDLDPSFAYVPLYAAGALAFNLNRPDSALLILRKAAAAQPREWKFRAYMAGIAFHKSGDAAKVLKELTPVLAEPDCPTMLKNILAFLNRRLGRHAEAARIYRDILDSRDPSYVGLARQALAQLGAEP